MISCWVSEVIKEPWPQSDLVERTELGKVNSTRLDEEFQSLVSALTEILELLGILGILSREWPIASWPETYCYI